uniref:cGMP-dependent protein kinase n=1 Tax=Mucochytrium quahogii TaxID=96639 RepID=A0A7S2W7P5_9STRA|mmetsp:Transcript_1490/g.2179  ORF Transcript_1490/g.2179 Transcript_1490/m.2179 type:complete len:856 (+) Transcript_1490:432-2999(+)
MGCSSSTNIRASEDRGDNRRAKNMDTGQDVPNYNLAEGINEIEIIPKEISPETLLLAQRIKDIPFLKMHSFRQIKQIASAMVEVQYESGQDIFRKEDNEDAFYVLKEPSQIDRLEVEGGPATMKTEIPTFFGETCLRYHNVKRRYTLRAKDSVVMLKISPEEYRNLIVQQAKQQESQHITFLLKVPILKDLTHEQLQALGRSLRHSKFTDGTKIITQGSHGSTFYFVESGVVKCVQKTQKGNTETVLEVNRYSAGDYFGEGALLQDAPRNADVVAVGEVTCLTLSRNDFNDLLGGVQQLLEHNFRARVLKGVELLSKLTDAERSELADLLIEQVCDPGEQIIRQGDIGEKFYIIKEGEVKFTRDHSPQGDQPADFVESLLLEGSLATHSSSSSANPILASSTAAAAAAAAAASVVSNSSLPPQAPPPIPPPVNADNKPSQQPAEAERSTSANGGSNGETAEEIGRLFTGQYFGEGALLTDAPRRANAFAVGTVTLLSLDRSIFSTVFDQSLQDMLNRNFEKRAEKDALIEFKDLQQIKVLGAGSYGQVLLVTNKVTGKTYALKTMQKQRIVSLRQEQHVINEKNILQTISHPFIVGLKQSYVSTEYVFVLLEAVLGGELFAYMQAAGRIKQKDALFYIAQVALVFEYLHSRNVIYRDLKPENLLVAANGYLKLTDFGLSKVLQNERKTYTLCGTPCYAAPEVYNLSGHGKAVDWWTLGVLTHELLSGTTPFDGDAEEIFASMEEYARAYPNIRLPRGLSGDVGDFALRLLNPNPNKRLGCLPRGGGARDVKMHSLFKGFSWTKLIQENTKAPFTPKIRSMYDTTNFYPAVVKGKQVQLANVEPESVRIAAEWTFT